MPSPDSYDGFYREAVPFNCIKKGLFRILGPIVPRGHRSSSWVAWPAVSGVLVHGANLIETRRWDKQTLARHDAGEQVSKSWQDKQET